MIKIAHRNIREAGLSDRINLVIGDGKNLSFRENSFEMVVSTGVLFIHSNPLKIIDEFYSVLKYGKEAWTYDFRGDYNWEEMRLRGEPDARYWSELAFSPIHKICD